MTVVGFTGHQDVGPETRVLVARRLLAEIPSSGRFEGATNLAVGADQLFAHLVLAVGGGLRAVIPCENYEDTFPEGDDLKAYRFLVDAAGAVDRLQFDQPSEDAFLAAGQRVVDVSDVLIAVWDGLGAVGRGGTADIVAYAKSSGVTVSVVWPRGARRGL